MGSMPMKYLLDTHAWIWWNMRPHNLSKKDRRILEYQHVQSLW